MTQIVQSNKRSTLHTLIHLCHHGIFRIGYASSLYNSSKIYQQVVLTNFNLATGSVSYYLFEMQIRHKTINGVRSSVNEQIYQLFSYCCRTMPPIAYHFHKPIDVCGNKKSTLY